MLVMFLKTMSFDVDITGIGSGFVTELCTMSMSIFKLALVGVFAKPAAAQMVEQINDMGNNALWVAFFGLFLSTTYFYYATMQQPEGKRYFHVLTTAITAIASLAYLVMAMGYGVVDVGGRPFYYARCKRLSRIVRFFQLHHTCVYFCILEVFFHKFSLLRCRLDIHYATATR
jgi:bacteriorhodopsin